MRAWLSLILLPFLSFCYASSWQGPTLPKTSTQDSAGSAAIPLYFPEYLSINLARFHRAPFVGRHTIGQFKKSVASQEEALGFRLTSEPSEKGLFCTLFLHESDLSGMAVTTTVFGILTGLIVPIYNDSFRLHVTYEVFSDAHFVRRYRYEVRGKTLFGLFALFILPFMSGHWHAMVDPMQERQDDLLQGLLSTLANLKADGQRDGLFK